MTYCSSYFSRKVKVLSFAAILSVVVLHCNSIQHVVNPSAVTRRFSFALWQLASWAVPFFFIVSGFFIDRSWARKGPYFEFLKKKCKQLLIPYILFGGVYGLGMLLLIGWLLALTRGMPIGMTNPLSGLAFWPALDKTFGILAVSPMNGALWYVRALFLFCLVSPVFVAIRRLSRPALVFLSLLFIGLSSPVSVMELQESVCFPGVGVVSFKLGSVGWILLGMAISSFRVEDRLLDGRLVWFVAVSWAWLLCVCIDNAVGEFASNSVWIALAEKFSPLSIIALASYMYDRMSSLLPCSLPEVMGLTFWIYCTHLPVCALIGALERYMLGKTDLAYYCQLITICPMVLLLCYVVAKSWKHCFPRLFAVMMGGR